MAAPPVSTRLLLVAIATGALAYTLAHVGNWPSLASSHALCVYGGILIALLGQHCLPTVLRVVLGAGKKKSEALYGLQHGRLNLSLPPSMWMNMGYWDATNEFPVACRNLLFETLQKAGVTSLSGPDARLSVLDLGFGCGEQTVYIHEWLAQRTPVTYIGITLNRFQHEYAQHRVAQSPVCRDHKPRLFCADAARPQSWDAELSLTVRSLSKSPTGRRGTTNNEREVHNHKWVLALDTLYHFSPSRAPIFTFAASELEAGLMAFDIIRSDSATLWQRVLLRIAALLAQCPSNTFVTEQEYRQMLVKAGYPEDGIEFHDITKHVFAPLGAFMKRQEAGLNAIGLRMGDLALAGKLFTWWAKSRVVRGVIVTARLRP